MQSLHVGLFVTCLVDFFRPSIASAAIQLLKAAKCKVSVPKTQTCCGQPFYNNGELNNSRAIATQVVKTFENFDYIVVPSGSCAGMIRKHYPDLLGINNTSVTHVCQGTYELTSFLTDVLHVAEVSAEFHENVTYHDSCSCLRDLNIYEQPRKLLKSVKNLSLTEHENGHVCCGFGGTFCVKYPDISHKMVSDKCTNIQNTGASTVLSADLGCLLNIAGKMTRQHYPIHVRHIAEVLTNIAHTTPSIGRSK